MQTLTTTYPVKNGKSCTLLLLSNLAYPQWVSVYCNDSLLDHVVCFLRHHKFSKWPERNADGSCDRLSISVQGKCYFFAWKSWQEIVHRNLHQKCFSSHTSENRSQIKIFQHLFEATDMLNLSLISTDKNKDKVLLSVFSRLWLTTYFSESNVDLQGVQGYIVCETSKVSLQKTQNNTHSCHNSWVISSLYLCDGEVDCNGHGSTGSDEAECERIASELNHIPLKIKNQPVDVSKNSPNSVLDFKTSICSLSNCKVAVGLQKNYTGHLNVSKGFQTRPFVQTTQCQIQGQILCDQFSSECFSTNEVCHIHWMIWAI